MDSDIEDIIKLLINEIKESVDEKHIAVETKKDYLQSQFRIKLDTVVNGVFNRLKLNPDTNKYEMSKEDYDFLYEKHLKR